MYVYTNTILCIKAIRGLYPHHLPLATSLDTRVMNDYKGYVLEFDNDVETNIGVLQN